MSALSNTTQAGPHVSDIATARTAGLLEELKHSLWGLAIHADVGMMHADVGDLAGLEHDAQCCRDCLVHATNLLKALRSDLTGHAATSGLETVPAPRRTVVAP